MVQRILELFEMKTTKFRMNNVFFLLDLQFILNERVIEFIFNKKSKQEL